MAPASGGNLEALGFCGADDSVNPRHLALIGRNYPLVEWGVLFRPDREGQPRYASRAWVERLSAALKSRHEKDEGRGVVRLAAHLCGSHVNDLLTSSTDASSATAVDGFLAQLHAWGFRRVQVNATAVNGVSTEKLGEGSTVQSFLRTVRAHPELEFIVQKNDETEPLWSGLLASESELPHNVAFLHDESKGTGKEVSGGYSADPRCVATSRKTVGYAGGITPGNVRAAAEQAATACAAARGERFWIDMESGVRTTVLHADGTRADVFDLTKCYDCIDVICEMGWMHHP